MQILRIDNEARHVFTERTDLQVRSFCNIYKRQAEYRQKASNNYVERYSNSPEAERFLKINPWKEINHATVIRYPHAVSCFSLLGAAMWYAAASDSKHRKAPVITVLTGPDTHPESGQETLAVGMAWAVDGNCISQTEIVRNKSIDVREGYDSVQEKLGHLFATVPSAVIPPDNFDPYTYLARLERELGIFIGSTPLEDFLAACTKVKETEYATVYKSDRLA